MEDVTTLQITMLFVGVIAAFAASIGVGIAVYERNKRQKDIAKQQGLQIRPFEHIRIWVKPSTHPMFPSEYAFPAEETEKRPPDWDEHGSLTIPIGPYYFWIQAFARTGSIVHAAKVRFFGPEDDPSVSMLLDPIFKSGRSRTDLRGGCDCRFNPPMIVPEAKAINFTGSFIASEAWTGEFGLELEVELGSGAKVAAHLRVPCEISKEPPAKAAQLVFTQDNWHFAVAEARSDRRQYKGSPVTLAGIVFNLIGRKNGATQLQMFPDPDERDQNTLVVIPWDLDVRPDQYVRVRGVLKTYHKSTNLFGVTINVPVVRAEAVEVVNRLKAFPPIQTVDLDSALTQHGLSITVVRIELLDNETRVFIAGENNSREKASLYAFSDDPVLLQGTTQIKLKSLYGDDYPEHDNNLLPGTATEGVLIFEGLDLDKGGAQLVWGMPRTEDFRAVFKYWRWNFSWSRPIDASQ